MAIVKLVREGQETELPIKLQITQVTPQAVATLYSIDIETIWLKEQFGQKAFFPNASKNSFDLIGLEAVNDEAPILIAMGLPAAGQKQLVMSAGSSHGMMTGMSTIRPVSWSGITSPRPTFSKKLGISAGTVNVKVVQAAITTSPTGKVDFCKKGQMFVLLRESYANVPYVTNIVQQNWGKNYVLVTADGLRLEDSCGTQGLNFWRVGSRKIYAVKENELNKGKGSGKKRKNLHVVDISSSEDEEYATKPTQKRKLSDIYDEIKALRQDINTVLKLTKGMSLPPGLYKQLDETFKCHICHSSPLQLPAIFARCCRNILGCGKCVDRCFKDDSKCPLCRSDRALPDTIIINGLDEFIKVISPLLNGSMGEPSTSDQSPKLVPPPPISHPFDVDSDADFSDL